MLFFVRHKPSEKIVACGVNYPNPFRKNSQGKYDSCSFHGWAVDPEHRRKGLAFPLMFGATSLLMWKDKIRYASGPVGAENKANTGIAQKLVGSKGRTHIILEIKV